MVISDMLRHPTITNWLGGVEPAWTSLDDASLVALRHHPHPVFGPIRLANDLTPDEIQQSPIARNALILLRLANENPGLQLTATGNLSRAVVARMIEHLTWPDFDMAVHFSVSKIANERDFFPLYFLRHIVEAARLIRRYKGHFRTTPAGRKYLLERNTHPLQAVLFHTTFWYLNLVYLSWSAYGDWPQRDVGTVLWSLSVAAHDWQTSEQLTRLCTMPTADMFGRPYDSTSYAMEGQILRPLIWFGLMEQRDGEPEPGQLVAPRFFRKTALFDRFLSFDIELTPPGASRH
jgi:hypothetical protein